MHDELIICVDIPACDALPESVGDTRGTGS